MMRAQAVVSCNLATRSPLHARNISIEQTVAYSIHTTRIILWSGIIVVNLNLDPAPRSKLRDDDLVGDFLEDRRVRLATKAIVVRMEVGSSDDILQVGGLRAVRQSSLTRSQSGGSSSRRSN